MPRATQDKIENKARPELELLLRSARPVSPENEKRMKELLSEELNWNSVLAAARLHKLAPVLYERMQSLNVDGPPREQREVLAELVRAIGRTNLVFLNEMLRVYGLFVAAGIPAIPFKGPSLAWLAYPKFAQRTCVDLDFVVPQRYIPHAAALLQSDGYTPEFSPAEAHAGERSAAPGQYAFAPGGNRCYVEIHTERTLRYFSRPLNLDEMNSRLIRLEIGKQVIPTFSVEDLLVMLCVHGAKHFWERLAWIVDIAQLVTFREVDWPLLFEIAAKMQSTRLLLLGLYLAHEMAGAPLPQSVVERVRADRQVRRLAGTVSEQFSGNSSVGVLPRAVFRFRSSDGYWQGLRQLFRLSMSPTESDRQTIQLPNFLSPLYTLVRPIRLLGEYGLHRRPKRDSSREDAAPPARVARKEK